MRKLTLLTFVFSTLLLTACGSSSGGDESGGSADGGSSPSGGGSTGDGSNGGGSGGESDGGTGGVTNSLKPITPYTLEITTFLDSKQQAGFAGDIEVATLTEQMGNKTFESFVYKLKDGIPSLNVANVKREIGMEYQCPESNTDLKGSGSSLVSYDYKAGKVTVSATGSGYSVSCIYTISSFTGKTITDQDSIEELLEEWGKDYEKNAISTSGSSCPKPDDGSGNTDPNDNTPTKEEMDRKVEELAKCKFSFIDNHAVTDGSQKVHKVAQGGGLPLGFLFLLMIPALLRFKK